MIVNKKGYPEVVKKEDGGQKVFDYVKSISEKAGLNTEFFWENDEIYIG